MEKCIFDDVKINIKWMFELQEYGENLLRISRGAKNSIGGIKFEMQSKVVQKNRGGTKRTTVRKTDQNKD